MKTLSPKHSPLDSLHAPELYLRLQQCVAQWWLPSVELVGIHSGGAKLATKLQHDLRPDTAVACISSALHRDDYGQRGLQRSAPTHLPFAVEGADILLIDDVLYTGRTLRAVLNELFDYGRPARVRLFVLVDRLGNRQLPFQPDFAAITASFTETENLQLAQSENGALSFSTAPRAALRS